MQYKWSPVERSFTCVFGVYYIMSARLYIIRVSNFVRNKSYGFVYVVFRGDFTDDLSSAAFVCCEYITLSRNENNPCYFLISFAFLCFFPIINWHINFFHSSFTVRGFDHKLALIVLIPKLLIHPPCKNPPKGREIAFITLC